MKKVLTFVFAGAAVFILVFLGGKYLFFGKKETLAGIKVNSIPQTSIFLDNKNIGQTPYEEKLAPGEYTLKLIPENTATTTASWQGKIKLIPSVLTYVNRELGATELESAGEILTLEKISGKNAELAITASPEGAQVSLDGQQKGVAPLSLSDISAGDHEIAVSSSGFVSRSIKIRTTVGYKLTAEFTLALTEGGTEPQEATEEGAGKETKKPYILVKETPTGWLRVRLEPSTSASEAGKVNPGDKLPFLEEKSGWFKIKFDSKEGWISGKYAEKVE